MGRGFVNWVDEQKQKQMQILRLFHSHNARVDSLRMTLFGLIGQSKSKSKNSSKSKNRSRSPSGMTTRKATATATATAKTNAGILPHSTTLRVRMTAFTWSVFRALVFALDQVFGQGF
jgi:hypothetical protein